MSRFRATAWVITCFTLAHSTTLAPAAFDVMRVPGRVVEPLIAATIIYVGVENGVWGAMEQKTGLSTGCWQPLDVAMLRGNVVPRWVWDSAFRPLA